MAVHKGAVGRPEILGDDRAVEHADETMQAGDFAVGEDDIEMRVAAGGYGTLAEPESPADFMSLDHEQRQQRVAADIHRLADGLPRHGRAIGVESRARRFPLKPPASSTIGALPSRSCLPSTISGSKPRA
jgi:hypothetical protein